MTLLFFKRLYYDLNNFIIISQLPTKTIRDQSSKHNLSKGNYRAKLGGTFTGVKYGAYAAYATKPATFTIK